MKNCINFLRRHEVCRVWEVSLSHYPSQREVLVTKSQLQKTSRRMAGHHYLSWAPKRQNLNANVIRMAKNMREKALICLEGIDKTRFSDFLKSHLMFRTTGFSWRMLYLQLQPKNRKFFFHHMKLFLRALSSASGGVGPKFLCDVVSTIESKVADARSFSLRSLKRGSNLQNAFLNTEQVYIGNKSCWWNVWTNGLCSNGLTAGPTIGQRFHVSYRKPTRTNEHDSAFLSKICWWDLSPNAKQRISDRFPSSTQQCAP